MIVYFELNVTVVPLQITVQTLWKSCLFGLILIEAMNRDIEFLGLHSSRIYMCTYCLESFMTITNCLTYP